MDVSGKIKVIGETKEYGKNGFQKRQVVLTTQEQYPQHLLIDFVQDKTQVLDKFSVGQSVKIGINLRGREWVAPDGEAKYFNSLNGWRIENLENSQEQAPPPPEPGDNFEPADSGTDFSEDDEDDLPF